MPINKKNTLNSVAKPNLKRGGPDNAKLKVAATGVLNAAFDQKAPKEINGPRGPEPTRYGDWEQKGRCTDF